MSSTGSSHLSARGSRSRSRFQTSPALQCAGSGLPPDGPRGGLRGEPCSGTVEPPGVSLGRVLFASNPSTDVGFSRLGRTGVARPPPFRQRIVGARMNLWMVKKVKQKFGKGSDQVAGPTHRGSGGLPGPKGLKERPTKGPGR